MQCTMYSQHAAQNTDRTGENSCTSNPNKLNTPETETQSNTETNSVTVVTRFTHMQCFVPSQKLVASD